MVAYPCAADNVAYNVPVNTSEEEYNRDAPVFCSVADGSIGILSYEEARRMHKYAYRCIRHHARERRLPLLTESHDRTWSIYSIGDPLEDRTLPVAFPYLPMVDESLVIMLQSDVFVRFPLWRIVHYEDAESPELSLAIYPDAISVGHEAANGDIGAELLRWRQAVERYREPEYGPARRQLNVIQAVVLSKPPAFWRRSGPSVIGAFDNRAGDTTCHAVWLVVRGASAYDCTIDGLDLAEGHCYSIMNSGRIGESMAAESPTKLWVRQVVLPAGAAAHGLTVQYEGRTTFLKVDRLMDERNAR